MLNKINITIGILAVVAMVSLLSFLNTVGAVNFRTGLASILGTSSLAPVESDVDGDGLLNTDESYWQTDFQNPDTDRDGFLDGEEVKSGHDPLIPGPNDLLPQAGNLTEKFSNLSVSGLYEGSLRPSSPDFDTSITQLTSLIVDDGLKDIAKGLNLDDIKFVETNSVSERIYLRDSLTLARSFIELYIVELKDFESRLELIGSSGLGNKEVVNYFKNKSNEADSFIKLILDLDVPNAWKDEHLQLLQAMFEFRNANLVIADGAEDPLKAALGLSEMLSGFNPFLQILVNYATKMESRSISPDSLSF